ncbi:MAG: hemerythrin domain-containing protein [Syntrophaceae bacterium]
MKPIGPMMWEHRLIERMLRIFDGEARRISEQNKVDTVFIDTAVDFIRTYADRTHHGKEEDILFRDMKKKQLAPEHANIMNDLIEEHKYARQTVGKLVDAKDRYLQGEDTSQAVVAYLKELAQFYPKHIEKEDKHFFYPCMEYFTKEEQDKMLSEFWEFDRKMIHEKYTKVVDLLTGGRDKEVEK